MTDYKYNNYDKFSKQAYSEFHEMYPEEANTMTLEQFRESGYIVTEVEHIEALQKYGSCEPDSDCEELDDAACVLLLSMVGA